MVGGTHYQKHDSLWSVSVQYIDMTIAVDRDVKQQTKQTNIVYTHYFNFICQMLYFIIQSSDFKNHKTIWYLK